MNLVLPIKSLYAMQREDPLGAILRWQFNQYEDILDFAFTDSGVSDYYGLSGNALAGGGDCYPSNARIYVFRQDNSPVDVDCINNYFFNLPGQYLINAWVMYHDINGTLPGRRFDKHRIFRDGTYYYAFVIKDLDTGNISDIVYANISIN